MRPETEDPETLVPFQLNAPNTGEEVSKPGLGIAHPLYWSRKVERY